MRRLIPIVLLLSLVACGGSSSSPDPSFDVEYRVTGSAGRAMMTYENRTGGTEQITTNVPWSYNFSTSESGKFLYVSAQNQNDSGTVRVQIFVDNVLYKEATSTGAYVIATASGSTP